MRMNSMSCSLPRTDFTTTTSPVATSCVAHGCRVPSWRRRRRIHPQGGPRTGMCSMSATPPPSDRDAGHTFHHLAYAVTYLSGPGAVFTGGSLLTGASGGRPVWDEAPRGSSSRCSTDRHIASPRSLVMRSTSSEASASAASAAPAVRRSLRTRTIGDERSRNIALTIEDEDALRRPVSADDEYMQPNQ